MILNKTETYLINALCYSKSVSIIGTRQLNAAKKLQKAGVIRLFNQYGFAYISRDIPWRDMLRLHPNPNYDTLRKSVEYCYSFLNFNFSQGELDSLLKRFDEAWKDI